MKGYSNGELAFRIVITFIEGFVGSMVVLLNGQDVSDKSIRQSAVIGGIGAGISATINFIKLVLEENKKLNIENNSLNSKLTEEKNNIKVEENNIKINTEENTEYLNETEKLIDNLFNKRGD